MLIRVVYSERARRSLLEIGLFIAGRNPDAALRLVTGIQQRLNDVLTVFPDEAEGYFLNVTAPEPKVFVTWRIEEDEVSIYPHLVTLSYNEAARWMDAQEKVESVAMPAEVHAALSAWVQENYQPPQKKQRIRPKSFESKDGRYDSGRS